MNPYKIVQEFEKEVAMYVNSPYALAVESCSAALFLCCLYYKIKDKVITIPKRTYPSVPASVINAGGKVRFIDLDWQKYGSYPLRGIPLIDSAKRLCRNMFTYGTTCCLSFHAKKALPIGRGGCVCTDNHNLAEFIRRMRHDGRTDGVSLKDDKIKAVGWNMLMTPEQAARGLTLIGNIGDTNILPYEEYPDLSECECYQ